MGRVADSAGEGLVAADRRRAEIQSHAGVFLLGILFGMTGVGMTSMVFLACCAEEMGATTLQFSVIPALWGLSTLPILFMAFYVSRIRRLKAFCLWTLAGMSATGLGFSVILLAPFPDPGLRIWALLGMALAGQFASNIFFAGFFAWLPHFVRRGRMGQFQSIRIMILMGAMMISHYLGGLLLGRVPGRTGFVALFGIGTGAGLLALVPTSRIPSPSGLPPPVNGLRETFGVLLRCRGLLLLFSYMLCYNFVAMLAGVFPTVFMKKDLLIPYERLGLMTALGSAGVLSATLLWGRQVDRYGGKPIMGSAGMGMALVCVLWAANGPGRITALPYAQFLGGVFSAAFSVSWLPLLYGAASPEIHGLAGSLSFLTWGVPGVISPFLGGKVVESLAGRQMEVAGMSLGGIQILFLLQALGYVLCLPLLGFVRSSREGGAEEADSE